MPRKFEYQDEPNLDELLSDPITWAVMKSDNVSRHDLRELLKVVAADLNTAGNGASDSDTNDANDDKYRKGVGIMLLNEQNQVFVGQRAGTDQEAWQMPQGGIDEDETPKEAALRELKEEIGTSKVRVVAESRRWLKYELPMEFRQRRTAASSWCGQRQKWFVMRFEGSDADINVATEHPEFSAWKWVSLNQLPNLIVSFKKQLYMDLVQEFSHLR